MESPPLINLISMAHMIFLCLWGGVVATEGVIELYPYRRKELHEHSIRYHFWIDLLVELPLIMGVVTTGIILTTLAWPLSLAHVIKILCAATAVSANLTCIVLVIKRKKILDQGADDADLWRSTGTIVKSAVVGIPLAAVAACVGLWLAYQRIALL